jgi:hypothetical protein
MWIPAGFLSANRSLGPCLSPQLWYSGVIISQKTGLSNILLLNLDFGIWILDLRPETLDPVPIRNYF